MSICIQCGGEIEFRYVQGRLIPLHITGHCSSNSSNRNSIAQIISLRSRESLCRLTTCNDCGNEVFFIKHNGGSVFIDPPLGPPWKKHDCFKSTNISKHNLVSTIASEFSLSELNIDCKNLLLGVVQSLTVDVLKRFTQIIFLHSDRHHLKLNLKNNADFLIGKLCFYSITEKEVWPVDEKQYLFAEYIHDSTKDNELTTCPICQNKISGTSINKHLLKQHGINNPEPEQA